MSDHLFCKWELLEHKYSERDLIQRLLDNAGANVEIATYLDPKTKEVINVALQNIDTGSVIIDFDLDGGDR